MAILDRAARSNLLIRSFKSPKWEIDLYLYFFLVFIIAIPASLSERSVTASLTQLWHWELVKLTQIIFTYLFLRIVKNFLQSRGRNHLYLYQVSLIGFIGGSSSTIFVYLGLNISNFLETDRNYLSFFIGNGVMGILLLPICCSTSVALKKFTQMNVLINSTLSINVINEIKQSKLFKDAVENEDRITSSQIIKIIENSKNKNVIKDFSSVGFKRGFKRGFNLFTFIKNIVSFYSIVIKSINFYKHSIRHKPLNPFYFTFIFSSITAVNVLRNDQSYRSLIIISYFSIYTYFFHRLQMFFYRNVKNWVWLSNLCDLLNISAIIATGYFLETKYNFFVTLNSSMITMYLMTSTLYFFLFFSGHISQSASIKYWEHKKNLEKYLNSDSFKLKILNQELEKDAFKWEQIIHGKLQSKILSNSIEEKSGSDDQFIGEIKELITQSLATSPKNSSNPTQIIELVSKPWSAVIDIQSEIDKSIAKQALSPSVTQTVTDVLEEAITNAVKHGGAEQVWLVVKANSSNSLQLQVKNNGAPVGKIKRQSIGTNLFNQSGIWSISNEDSLVVFKMRIDI